MNRAHYNVVLIDLGLRAVFIVDNKVGKSITNDAERVVLELNDKYPTYRVIYKDTMDRWDELCHSYGKFTGYAPYNHRVYI